jgi:hypothetical protein
MSGRVNYWPVACQEIPCPVMGILLHADLLPAIPQPATEIIFQASPVSCLSGNTMSIHRNDNSIQIPVDSIELRHSDWISVDFMEFRQCQGWIWKIHPMAGHEISDNATFNAFGPVPGYNTHLINASSMMAEINCLLRV